MKNKLIHLTILTSLVAAGGFALTSNLHAQEIDVDAAIKTQDYQALTKYYQGLADEQRAIAEEYHQKLSRMGYTSRGGQVSLEAQYREPMYEALEKADEYDDFSEKYEKLMNDN